MPLITFSAIGYKVIKGLKSYLKAKPLTILYVIKLLFRCIKTKLLMTATQFIINPTARVEMATSYNSISTIAALQSELEILQAKVVNYYHDEIVLRGDKILMREYCGHFDIKL